MNTRPDTNLIELGLLFNQNKSATAKLKRALNGDKAGYRAFTRKADETIKIMRAIHRTPATTIEGIAIKLDAIWFDLRDFGEDPAKPDVAEVHLLRLCKAVRAMARRPSPKPTSNLTTLLDNHRTAFKAWVGTEDEEWDTPAAKAAGDKMDAAHDALFSHRPVTLEEAREKAAYMVSCRSFLEWDSIEKIKLIEALTPAEAPSSSGLATAIAAFLEAKRAYDAVPPDLDKEGAEWDAYEATEHAVVTYPCKTFEEVQLKARFFLDNDGPYDTIKNCFGSTEETLRPFLRSLLGEGGAL